MQLFDRFAALNLRHFFLKEGVLIPLLLLLQMHYLLLLALAGRASRRFCERLWMRICPCMGLIWLSVSNLLVRKMPFKAFVSMSW